MAVPSLPRRVHADAAGRRLASIYEVGTDPRVRAGVRAGAYA